MESDEYSFMDNIAKETDTDKSSFYHDYTRIYSKYFKALKNDPITFLEIGIYKGSSVKLWEAYFPKAELHFIDIDPNLILYHSKRSQYHFIDQSNVTDLQNFAKTLKKELDVIIDDGGHTMVQQITSLTALFPFVKSGGLYIIEDLHTSYWKEYGGYGSKENPLSGEKTTIGFLKYLIDEINFVGASTGKASFDGSPFFFIERLDFWKRNVYSIHFYDSICIIIKR